MINKNDVKEFFDKCATNWDAEMIRNDDIINKILDNAAVKMHSKVLDVACGTGVLIPDYLSRDVESVTAIDISEEMIKIAKSKFHDEKVKLICGDVMEYDVGKGYDAIVIYNAFPHFANPDKLIKILSEKLNDNGRITVAHGMSREKIDAHHKGSAIKVSNGLMEAEKLADIFNKYTNVIKVVSDDNMYQVVGEKRRI